jgi:hypothetical protein
MGLILWEGGEHAFALDIGGLRALQTACDAGPQQILNRIVTGAWRVDDLYQTIRLGLIGGGMAAAEAARVTDTSFKSHPMMKFRAPAQAVLVAALIGDPDDPLGEATGAPPPPENGGSATSTGPEPS